MSTKTTWQEYTNPHSYPSLKGTQNVDVAIIGGGLTGIWVAYSLTKAGKSVAVLEADTIGNRATAKTTGFLTQEQDTDLHELVHLFGKPKAKLIWESHAKAIEQVETVIQSENIACDFVRCSAFVYASKQNQLELVYKDYNAAKELNTNNAVLHESKALPFTNFGSWEIKHQAKYHALKFLFGLAAIAKEHGAAIFEHSTVTNISEADNITVYTEHGSIKAKDVVIATYFPFTNPKITHYKKGMYASYILEARIPQHAIPQGLYWDYSNPYYYFRIDPGTTHDFLMLGGADHRAALPISEQTNFHALEDYVTTLLPGKQYTIAKRWKGPILEPSDGLALIGNTALHQYVATAFSGNGMTYAPLAAGILRDEILGIQNEYAKLYSPARHIPARTWLQKGWDYTQEFLGGAAKNVFRYGI